MKHIVNNTLNKFIIHLILSIYMVILSASVPMNLEMSPGEIEYKLQLIDKISWLTDRLHTLYYTRAEQYKVPLALALAIIQVESGGLSVRSHRANKNKTYDWGRFQINECHLSDTPHLLLNDIYNSKYGFYYLSLCLKKAKGNLKETIRMYNQGANSKQANYTRWNYVSKVIKYYRRFL